MDRKNLYWLLQVLGWTLFGLINLFLVSLERTISWTQVGAFFSLSLLYMLTTHGFRLVIKSRQWLQLKISALIVRAILSLLLLAVLNTIGQIVINWIFGLLDVGFDFRQVVLLGNVFVSFIFYALWTMVYVIFHFLDNYNQTLRYEAKINEIQLNHLKSQLNPHFIFNALNSVRALVDEDPGKAKVAITQLSNILRFSLMMDKKRTIDFEKELNTVKDYLNLESVRYEERLRVEYDIDPVAYEYRVPPMMLQTIVENAIKHGISSKLEGGTIKISCYEGLDAELIIMVKNTGQLTAKPATKRKSGEGHGINNTIQRLKLIYGNKASFKIYNAGIQDVVTQINIPKNGIKV
ncbi:MAG: sensor histidine kinase [Nitritalea sp.]